MDSGYSVNLFDESDFSKMEVVGIVLPYMQTNH